MFPPGQKGQSTCPNLQLFIVRDKDLTKIYLAHAFPHTMMSLMLSQKMSEAEHINIGALQNFTF